MLRKFALSPKSSLRVLGIDVCSGFCSVAVIDAETLLAMKHEAMTRGHAERLAPMVTEVLGEAKLATADLDGIAVTTGPGSFTGARLGVSFARGLALATGVPTIGVTIFEAMAHVCDGEQVVISLKGKNGTVLLQNFSRNIPVTEPKEISATGAWKLLPKTGTFTGTGTETDLLLASSPDEVKERCIFRQLEPITSEVIARIGILRLDGTREAPAPLYLRAPDAKPQAPATLSG